MRMLAFIKALNFMTSLNYYSQAYTCKLTMEKYSYHFWHPCGIKWHGNCIYRLLRRLLYKLKFLREILHCGLVFLLSATSLILLKGLCTMLFSTFHRKRYIFFSIGTSVEAIILLTLLLRCLVGIRKTFLCAHPHLNSHS